MKHVKTLTRHLTLVHKNEKAVEAALKLPSREKHAFKQLKRNGINKFNVSQCGSRRPKIECERAVDGRKSTDLAICSKCQGYFSKRYFSKHKKLCDGDSQNQPTSIPAIVHLADTNVTDGFKEEILSKFVKDEVGTLCIQDKTLLNFGQRMYFKLKAKKDKKLK
jgi:hypothetical protein